MEKSGASPIPLTILHHDDRLVFPGYDAMVGQGGPSRDEEDGTKPSTAESSESTADSAPNPPAHIYRVWYKKHKRKLVVVTIIWLVSSCSLTLNLTTQPIPGTFQHPYIS